MQRVTPVKAGACEFTTFPGCSIALSSSQASTVVRRQGAHQRNQIQSPGVLAVSAVCPYYQLRVFPMNIRYGALLAAVFLALVAGLPAQTRTFPVDEIRPGMIAV